MKSITFRYFEVDYSGLTASTSLVGRLINKLSSAASDRMMPLNKVESDKSDLISDFENVGKVKMIAGTCLRIVNSKDVPIITEDMLKQQGVSFYTAMSELKKYCGMSFKKSSFITFGNHDMKIVSSSISYSFDFPKEIVQCIQQNYIDFSAFISEFMRDDKGNPLSLIRYCDAFGVKQAGPAHDPAVDAENLAWLYDATMRKSSLLVEEYKKVLKTFNHFPVPVANTMKKLANNENVTYQEFEEEIKKYIE